jgi:hypothetical protein
MVVTPINYLISWFLDIIYHNPAYTFKSRIKEINQRCLSKKNGEQMYRYLAIDSEKSYFAKAISNLIINKNKTRSFKCYIF